MCSQALRGADALISAIADSGFLELPVTARHAAAVARLPDVHSDPFDRLLIAQAISEPLRFLTADDVLGQYSDLVELV
jgi:PIN domain nuclease of toxin-antitoxin system